MQWNVALLSRDAGRHWVLVVPAMQVACLLPARKAPMLVETQATQANT
jgi:hypothetical protein